MGSQDITLLDLFSSVNQTVNFNCLELRSQTLSSEQLRSRNEDQFPCLSGDQGRVAQHEALHSFGGQPVC